MKILLILFILLFSLYLNAQIPIEVSVFGGGSDINGILGTELQVFNFSLSESWRPMSKDINSYVTTVTTHFKKNYFESCPYFSVGYATKGYPYLDKYNILNYEKKDIKYSPAIFLMAGYKTIIYPISDRLSGKAGLGLTLSEHGEVFSFELLINYVLFRNKLNNYVK